MEGLLSGLKDEGHDIYTSTRYWLPTRPTGMGVGDPFENLGGTLKPPSQKGNASGGSKPASQASSQSRSSAAATGYSKFKPSMRSRPLSPMPKARGYSSQNAARSRSNSVAAGKSTTSQSTRPPPYSAIDVSSDSGSSDDPIDLLSPQPNGEDDPSSSQKPVNKPSKFKPSLPTRAGQSIESKTSKAKASQGSMEIYVDPNGRKHEYDRNFLPAKEKSIAGLKFKKTKKGEVPTEVPVPLPAFQPSSDTFSPVMSQEALFKEDITSHTSDWPEIHIPDKEDDKSIDVALSPKRAGKEEEKHVSPLGTKCVKSNRRSSPPPSQSRIPLPTRVYGTSSSPSENVASQEVPVGPPKKRPKPRPVRKASTTVPDLHNMRFKKTSDAPSSSQLTGCSSLTKMLDNVPVGNDNSGRSQSRSRSLECSSPRKSRPSGFPGVSPLGSAKRDPFANMSPLSSHEPSKSLNKAMKPKASSSRLPSAFPMAFTPAQSKEEDDEKSRVRPFWEKTKDKGKGKAKASSDGDDDDDDDDDYEDYEDYKSKNKEKEKERKRKMAKPKAFPMSTQVLASIGSRGIPSSSPLDSPRHGKRSSEGGSEDERVSKRSKKDRDLPQESPSQFAFDDEGDSLLMSNVDPSTLCPYCDLPLPSNPSPLLLKLLAVTKKKSQRDPRPYNPLGLKAPLTTFIGVCQRHRFESQILPEAEKKGWPKTVEWKEVGSRVLKMRSVLKALIEDPGHDVVLDDGGSGGDKWEVGYTKGKGKEKKTMKGPKARSKFWVDVMEEVKKKGLRAVSGVRGQFANFEKTQPGYYGELGSVIIHQTLYNMFPLDGTNPTLTAPLTANEFIERILVPEVALRLIMEDKDLDTESEQDVKEALEILRESSSYGVAMFPEDGGEWGGRKKKGSGDDDEEKLGVGDLIVMERARKRRKELEEEEEREMEELRRMEEEKQRQEDEKEREKEKEKERTKKNSGGKPTMRDLKEAPKDPSVERPRPRPRPRPLVKDSSARSLTDASADLQKEGKQIRSSKSRTRSVTRSRSRSIFGDNGRPSSEERRRSPSASESRTVGDVPSSPRVSRSDYMADREFGWDSDASSNMAVVNGSSGGALERKENRGSSRARSRSRSTSVRPKRVERSSDSRMEVEQNHDHVNANRNGDGSDDGDEVEVLGLVGVKTPVQTQKGRFVMDVDDEPTPKAAAPARAPPAKDTSIHPLLAARQRVESKKQGSSNSGRGSATGPPQLGMTRRPTKAPTWDRDRERSLHRTSTVVIAPLNKKNGVTPGFSWLLSDDDRNRDRDNHHGRR